MWAKTFGLLIRLFTGRVLCLGPPSGSHTSVNVCERRCIESCVPAFRTKCLRSAISYVDIPPPFKIANFTRASKGRCELKTASDPPLRRRSDTASPSHPVITASSRCGRSPPPWRRPQCGANGLQPSGRTSLQPTRTQQDFQPKQRRARGPTRLAIHTRTPAATGFERASTSPGETTRRSQAATPQRPTVRACRRSQLRSPLGHGLKAA